MKPDKKNTSSHQNYSGGKILTALFVVSGGIVLLINVLLFPKVIAKGAEAAGNAFDVAKVAEKAKVYDEYYERHLAAAKENYHVSNRTVIVIDKMRECAQLEVLRVNAVGYSMEDQKDNRTATSWIKVSGTGVFTADLAASEYLVDNEHQYIRIRVPKPELTHFTIETREQLIYEDGTLEPISGFSIFNGSNREGTNLAQKQVSQASLDAKASITSNQRFHQSAEKSAQILITNLIKEFNPEIPDLTVEVEFMD